VNPSGPGPAPLMRLPEAERARIKAEGLARIVRSRENEVRKELLTECFDNYLALKPGELSEFDRFRTEQFPEANVVVNTSEDLWRVKGKRETLRLQLEKKFGPLSRQVLEQIVFLPVERLDDVLLAILDAKSLEELGLTG
jgi:hypothetical protein